MLCTGASAKLLLSPPRRGPGGKSRPVGACTEEVPPGLAHKDRTFSSTRLAENGSLPLALESLSPEDSPEEVVGLQKNSS